MKKQSERDFRGLNHVDVKTTHGLAWNPYGKRYQEAGKLITSGSYRAINVIHDLDLDDNYKLANYILSAWNKYLLSEIRDLDEYLDENYPRNDNYTKIMKYNVKKLWKLKTNLKNHVKVEHDLYFKEFYNDGAKVVDKYDALIVDECQDSSGIVHNIFNSSKCEQKFALGDDKQSIYSFRGAVNIMKKLQGHQMTLPESFRIGERSAEICSLLYEKFLDEKFEIIGVNNNQKTFYHSPQINPFSVDKCAVICRTNAMIVGNAIEMAMKGKSIYFVGGIGGYKLDFYNKLWWFACGKEVQDYTLNKFRNYRELCDYAEEAEDVELLSAIGIVKLYNKKLSDGLKQIKEMAVGNQKQANVILSTAHKIKGLTLTMPVFMESDFISTVKLEAMANAIKLSDKKSIKEEYKKMMIEPLNLLYVAITRSKGKLFLNEDISKWLIKLKTQEELNGKS